METRTVISLIMFSIVPIGAIAIGLRYRFQRRFSKKKTHQPDNKPTPNNSAEISNSQQIGVSSQGS